MDPNGVHRARAAHVAAHSHSHRCYTSAPADAGAVATFPSSATLCEISNFPGAYICVRPRPASLIFVLIDSPTTSAASAVPPSVRSQVNKPMEMKMQDERSESVPSDILTSAAAARFIGMSESWLRQSRMSAADATHPPPFIKIGRAVRYLKRDLEAWLDGQRQGLQIASPQEEKNDHE